MTASSAPSDGAVPSAVPRCATFWYSDFALESDKRDDVELRLCLISDSCALHIIRVSPVFAFINQVIIVSVFKTEI